MAKNKPEDWEFGEGYVKHIPCNQRAYVENKKLICFKCEKPIPKFLELPAQVFNAYKKRSIFDSLGDLLINIYTQDNIKELSDLDSIYSIIQDDK